tara:strand:+ start:250 stop:678 length:429 start_codon:yes stop_codon:yes gene_type:complete
MTLIKWKPRQLSINEFDNMINNIFNDGWNIETYKTKDLPAVDIVENDDKFVLKADFPGFEKKDIDLAVENDVLKISATHSKKENDITYTIRERQTKELERSFTLPESVIANKISAKFKNGMLVINIPKAKEEKAAVQNIKIN